MNPIENLNKAFDNRIRLGIMSLLMVEDLVDFVTLKNKLNLTDGNLATHLLALEREAMIEVLKGYVGRKPQTNYQATPLGRLAFKEHLKALEAILTGMKK